MYQAKSMQQRYRTDAQTVPVGLPLRRERATESVHEIVDDRDQPTVLDQRILCALRRVLDRRRIGGKSEVGQVAEDSAAGDRVVQLFDE